MSARAAYGVQVVDNVFQGYYSSFAHHPTASLKLSLSRTSFELRGELWLRRYGSDSYAAGRSHPALTYGDRRSERIAAAQIEVRWQLSRLCTLLSNGKLVSRRANFPAYQPGVFPRMAQHSIDWNYDNWQAMLGVELRSDQ
jgi:hypothetical protein